jgi:stage II sporulation protein D
MKKKLTSLVVVLTLLLSIFAVTDVSAASSDIVKVKLKNYFGNQKDAALTIKGEYRVKEDNSVILKSNTQYYVRLQNGDLNLYQGGQKLKSFDSSFTIEPKEYGQSNYLSINNRDYLGNMQFTKEGSYIRPVNSLPLEDYLKGVVPGEMPAAWDVDALKAQAVAARTYAKGKLNQTIDDTISYQVYTGYTWNSSLYKNSNQAVNETAGEVLRSNGSLISAVYSSSNGGHTESALNYWGYAHSYLPAKPDPFDPKNSWGISLNKVQIDTNRLDLLNPDSWWNSVSEQREDHTIINRLKNYIVSQNNNFSGAEIKIVDIPTFEVTGSTLSDNGKPTGNRTNGTLKVDYFVKNSKGQYLRDNGSSLPDSYFTTIGGKTRYDTSVEISDKGWDSTSPAVVLGRGDIHVDAITGTVLAKKLNSPLLLTESTKLPDNVFKRIKELKPDKVYLLGGEMAISPSVKNQIEELNIDVIRVSGPSRFRTSVEIAKEVGNPTEVFLTSSSEESPDALSIASYAAKMQKPVLLTESAKLDSSVKKWLKNNSVQKVTIIGGTDAVSKNVENEVNSLGISEIDRVDGDTRYHTSVNIAKKYNFNLDNFYFAQGKSFIDALPGAVLASGINAPVLLTEKDQLPKVVSNWIKELGKRPHIYFLGGEDAISNKSKNDVKNALIGEINRYTLNLDNVEIGKLRSLIGVSTFKSYQIEDVQLQNGKHVLKGYGYGHGVGMSQYGAKARAEAGQTYREILNFYYPGTTLGK